jgi:hypothetical protein
MSHIKDDTDKSISRDSVLDWGFNPGSNNREASTNSVEDGPSSRYDPRAMSRIVDINDLVDESSSEDEGEEVLTAGSAVSGEASIQSNQKKRTRRQQYGPGGMGCRQVLILVSLLGIIVAASLAIGYAVIGGNPSSSNNNLNGRGSANSVRAGTNEEQLLLEMAERITIACSEANLDEDMSECQMLCHENLCCFEESSSEYSCEDDESKACAVYAGCYALVQGVPIGAADEEEA